MNWVVRRIRILFEGRLTKMDLKNMNVNSFKVAYEIRNDPEQLTLMRKLIELLEKKNGPNLLPQ